MSQENIKEFAFIWKIRNFSLCFHKNEEVLFSPVFTTEKFGGSQWNLQIYPKGYRKEDEGCISLFLGKEKNDEYTDSNTVNYDLSIVGIDGTNLATQRIENHVFENGKRWGFYRFIKTSKVNDELKHGSEDVLVIRCCIFANDRQKSPPDYEACTEIGVNQTTFLWNIKFPDNSPKEVSTKINFSTKSLYNLNVRVFGDEVKISVDQKEEDSVLSKFIKGKLSFVTARGKVITSVTDAHLFQTDVENDSWEFPSFITRGLFDPDNCLFLKEDDFTLLCEFFASDRVVSETVVGSKRNLYSDICPNLLKEMKNMLCNQIYCDVKLKADNEIVLAHKSVLAARSPVFSAMFEQDMIESSSGTVIISDMTANTLKSFLEFIYVGKVENFDYEMAKELLLVAEKYQVMSLKEKCVSLLEYFLSLRNVCEVLSLADMTNQNNLKGTAVNFIATNSAIVFKLPEWLNLIRDNAKLASETFSNIAANFDITPKNISSK